METITQAAIKFYLANDAFHQFPIVMSGKRHGDISLLMHTSDMNYDRQSLTYGFWTSNNRFVDRYEAKAIAVAANQLIVPIEETYAELYSEDVW